MSEDKIISTLGKIGESIEYLKEKVSKLETTIDGLKSDYEKLNKTEIQYFEYISSKVDRIEQKHETNFEYLNNKIDSESSKMISDITEIFQTFADVASKTVENVENKIDNEELTRKYEIDRLKNLNDYDKIILKNLESRISILEEETQSYNKKYL